MVGYVWPVMGSKAKRYIGISLFQKNIPDQLASYVSNSVIFLGSFIELVDATCANVDNSA